VSIQVCVSSCSSSGSSVVSSSWYTGSAVQLTYASVHCSLCSDTILQQYNYHLCTVLRVLHALLSDRFQYCGLSKKSIADAASVHYQSGAHARGSYTQPA
jgi:hypothetical protein